MGQSPGVGVIWLEGTYPQVTRRKKEYPLPLVVEDLIKEVPPMVAWELLDLEAKFILD